MTRFFNFLFGGGVFSWMAVMIVLLTVGYGISRVIHKLRGIPEEPEKSAKEMLISGIPQVPEKPSDAERWEDEEREKSLLERACSGKGAAPRFARNIVRQERDMIRERLHEEEEEK